MFGLVKEAIRKKEKLRDLLLELEGAIFLQVVQLGPASVFSQNLGPKV